MTGVQTCALPIFEKAVPATEEDWHTEYGEPIISVRIVDDLDDAIEHIALYSSHHTEAIITSDIKARDRFFARIDSATRDLEGDRVGSMAKLPNQHDFAAIGQGDHICPIGAL